MTSRVASTAHMGVDVFFRVHLLNYEFCNERAADGARSAPAKAEGRRRNAARTRVKQNVY